MSSSGTRNPKFSTTNSYMDSQAQQSHLSQVSAMNKVGISLQSTLRVDKGNTFSRAQDRFKPAAMKI